MSSINLPNVGIERVEISGKRFYSYKGKIAPSVTTILSNTKEQKTNDFLTKWNTDNPGARDKAAERGTAVHEAIETYLLNGRIPDKSSPTVEFFNKVYPLLKQLTPLFIEAPLFHPEYMYAGTADCGAYYGEEKEGLAVLIDWKTSSKPRKSWYDYPLQLAAYAKAINYLYCDILPQFEYAMICCVNPFTAPQIELYDIQQINYHWSAFKQRLALFNQLSTPI